MDKIIVICGLAKTGTTLPLTLLDSHPQLLVYPEELHFFHEKFDVMETDFVVDNFFNNESTKMLAAKDLFFDAKNYLAHGGTGFGKRDYSNFNYKKFKKNVKQLMSSAKSSLERFFVIVKSFKIGCGYPIDRQSIFVCKAPHNELYSKEWVKMLGDNVMFIITTRTPTEHFLSLKNSLLMTSNDQILNPYSYVNQVKERRLLWNNFPRKNRFILDYDSLINDKKKTMLLLCDFLQIKYNNCLDFPTKMGVPWAGNSSRSIVKEKVFKNPHTAKSKLSNKEIEVIETGLKEMYEEFGWYFIIGPSKNIFIKLKILLNKFLKYFRKCYYFLCRYILPTFVKNFLKKIFKKSYKKHYYYS